MPTPNPRLFAVCAFVPLILMDVMGGASCNCRNANHEIQYAPEWFRTVPNEPGIAFYEVAYGDLKVVRFEERVAICQPVHDRAFQFARLENYLRQGGARQLLEGIVTNSKLTAEEQAAIRDEIAGSADAITNEIMAGFSAEVAKHATIAASQDKRYSTPRFAYHVLARVDFDSVANWLFERMKPTVGQAVANNETAYDDFKKRLAEWQAEKFGRVAPPPAENSAATPATNEPQIPATNS